MKTLRMKTVLFLVLAAVMLLNAPAVFATLTVRANHEQLNVDFNYHGGKVSISGESEPGTDVVLKIASPAGHEKLMRKDHVGGVIWMKTEEVIFENVPGVYFLMSSRPPGEILDEQERAANGIGYDALAAGAEISAQAGPEGETALFDEFIKYKESKRLFTAHAGDVTLKPGATGQAYSAMLDWPYEAPPGRYLVTAYAVKDGAVVERAETEVLVEQVGVVKTLSNMASDRGGTYGIVAIAIALAAGFGVGLVFKKSGGAH